MIEAGTTTLLERYQRLVDISRDLASTLELNTLLNRIVQAAADLSNAQAASILLYDSASQELYFEATTNLDEPLMRGLTVPVESSIAGWIVTQRLPIIIHDARNDPRHFNQIGKATKLQTISMLGVPLITKDKVIGVLEAINKLTGRFTDEDQNLLMALGAQAAVAIENSRLFQQTDLISEMVHELRTPLSSLNTAAYILLRPEIDAQQRSNIVKTIHREIDRLNEMTSAFLELARLESGRAKFRAEKISLPDLANEAVGIMRGPADEKGQDFTLEVEEVPPVQGDPDKLKQVLLNLLSNAIKYTPPGGDIRMAVKASNDEAQIQVKDSGRGIEKEHLPHIFEKFYRVPSSEKAAAGTGLGLSICRRIIDAHGGTIDVCSEMGAGTTFTVRLPVKIEHR